jgi:hypothetical protein
MMTTEEKVAHAYEENALNDLLMGMYPYYEPEAYMAPSTVPTNWRSILEALSGVSSRFPDIAAKVTAVLVSMTQSAEGLYSTTEILLAYLDLRKFMSDRFVLDETALSAAIRRQLPLVERQARSMHLDWMGPTNETLWERIVRTASLLAQEHGVRVV